MGIRLKTKEDIAVLQELGRMHTEMVEHLSSIVHPGITTADLEEEALRLIKDAGVRPAFKGYKPYGAPRAYPCALCVAPNNIVVHGIPTEMHYLLKEGDIIGIDLGIERDGFVIDAGKTVSVGKIDEGAQKLLRVTYDAMMAGIAQARIGNHIGDIGHAIETYVRKSGLGLVRDLCGHGVGYAVHEDPQVTNFGAPGTGPLIEEGLVIAIEPMVNEKGGAVVFENDGYTVTTQDGGRSAHFEHNVAVTKDGPLILTKK